MMMMTDFSYYNTFSFAMSILGTVNQMTRSSNTTTIYAPVYFVILCLLDAVFVVAIGVIVWLNNQPSTGTGAETAVAVTLVMLGFFLLIFLIATILFGMHWCCKRNMEVVEDQ
jgi:phosphoglycerol transferase MdoB-like AlkP superfamily enzyme